MGVHQLQNLWLRSVTDGTFHRYCLDYAQTIGLVGKHNTIKGYIRATRHIDNLQLYYVRYKAKFDSYNAAAIMLRFNVVYTDLSVMFTSKFRGAQQVDK